jgi:hypothetical protein
MPGLKLRLYECQVTGVSSVGRTIDALSRNGTRFAEVGYLLPWTSPDGAGVDFIPKVGDSCLIVAQPQVPKTMEGPSRPRLGGRGRFAICIGFRMVASNMGGGIYGGNRPQDWPQGSVGIRTFSEEGNEAMLLLTRGGTALLAANETCRTIYSPVDSSIIHIFNNWELEGPGGNVLWYRENDSDRVQYEANYRTLADEDQSGTRVRVRVGVSEDDPVEVLVHSGDESLPFLRVRVDSNGEAFIEGQSINIHGEAGVDIDAPQITIKGRQVLGQGDPI